jgi:hypothetical protein
MRKGKVNSKNETTRRDATGIKLDIDARAREQQKFDCRYTYMQYS